MSEFLVIRLGKTAAEPVQWIAADASGARRGDPGSGSLDEARASIGDRNAMVLVPSAEVLTTSVDIPVRGGAKLQAALRYALEEHLAEDIDKLHFAAGAKRPGGRIPVSVVSHDRMQEWTAVLAAANIQASAIVADSYGLARIPGTISMLLSDNQVFVNDGEDMQVVMEDVSPAEALAAIGVVRHDGPTGDDTTVKAAPRHLLVYCEASDEERFQHDWIAMREELASVDVKLLADGVLPRLAVTVASGAGVNLLQGRYGVRKEYAGIFRPWRYAAILLLVFTVLGIVGKATEYLLLLREETGLKREFNAEYQALLPGAPATDDPARVIESLKRRVGGAISTPVFLQSMQQLSRAMQQNREAKIEAISYRNGVVDIRLSAPSVPTLASIQEAIGDSGRFRATIQSTSQEGDKVQGRIQIQEAGS